MPKICLYSLRELHLPVLLPIYHALKKMGFKDVGISSPPFQEGQGNRAEEGLRPKSIEALKKTGVPFWENNPDYIAYDCVVTADACYDRVEGWGPVVCVGHGTISKNIYFLDHPNSFRENYAAAMCVPGEWYTQSFGKSVDVPLIPTGFSKMDELHRDENLLKVRCLAQADFSMDKTSILFAPTFNPDLNSMDLFYNEWAKLDPQKYQVYFKLHGAASEEAKEKYRFLANSHNHLYFVEDKSLVPWMLSTDIMVSDLSSAWLEYFCTGNPVILGINPQLKTSDAWGENTVEFIARKACYEVENPNDLPGTIEHALNNDSLKTERAELRQRLFPEIDGKNCHRVAQVVNDLLRGKIPSEPPYLKKLSVYIPEDIVNPEILLQNLAKLEFSYELWSHTSKHDSLLARIGQKAKIIQDNSQIQRPIVSITGQYEFAYAWDRMYGLFRKWAPKASLSAPMLENLPEHNTQQLQKILTQNIQAETTLLQNYAKYFFIHLNSEADQCLHDGFVIDLKEEELSSKDLGETLQNLHNSPYRQQFIDQVRTQGKSLFILAGYFGIKR